MPFAPSILTHRAAASFERTESAAYSAAFMTVCFDCKPDFKCDCPTVVHVDGTARPQFVNSNGHTGFFKILTEYEKLTGFPAVVNTSFNIHEEPIVCTPSDALRAFSTAKLDYLALGRTLVSRRVASGRP
jgi:carbamoyltransferase